MVLNGLISIVELLVSFVLLNGLTEGIGDLSCGASQRDVLFVAICAFGMLTPLLIRGGRLCLLKSLEHLHVLLVDLLDLLLPCGKVECPRSPRHRN